jgi:hypothetical protein
MDLTAPITPIACDMTGAPDTGPERLREYQRLFSQALIGRETTASGVRFRFRAQPGTEAWVRDLAAREKACCAFFTFTITALGEEVRWDATVIDDDIARAILEEFYALPGTAPGGFEGVHDRFTRQGLQFKSRTFPSAAGAGGVPAVGARSGLTAASRSVASAEG